MSDILRSKLSEALHEAKAITFTHASELESFARGVEHGLGNALILANQYPSRAHCAKCGQFKETPLLREEMGGYVCLSCIDETLTRYYIAEEERHRAEKNI